MFFVKKIEGTITDKTLGWSFKPSDANGDKAYYAFEGYYPDRGGRLESEIFSAEKFPGEMAYYRLQFTAQTSQHCYWGVDFFDNNNQYAQPDHNDRIWAGPRQKYERLFQASESVTRLQLFFMSTHGVDVSDIQLEKVSSREAADWCEQVYTSIPPFDYHLPVDVFKQLPRTIDAVSRGKPLRVLLLGDSIINDTWNSMFYSRLQRDLPLFNLTFICSVRGSTGCWYYQIPENFKTYVGRYKPDLLIIGGISQNNDIAAIGQVIDSACKQLGCEILLLSGAYARDTRIYDDTSRPDAELPATIWNLEDEFSPQFIEQQSDKSSVMHQTPPDMRLLMLATDTQVAFIDMTTPTYKYVYASGKPYEFFNRNRVHSNIYGKQIIGQILYQIFMDMVKADVRFGTF